MSEFWAALEAISTAIGTLVVIAACVYAGKQVREARQVRHVTLLLAFQQSYHSIESREFRRKLISGAFGDPDHFDPEDLQEDDLHRFWQLHDQLEVLGVLTKRKLIDFELVLASFHRSPPMVWNSISPYIKKRRQSITPLESVHFEYLVKRYEASEYLVPGYWSRISKV
ncbi:hypothetical protein AB0L53_12100 [Nonomuraea sp. NPDC052129]|uniref:DUF4760 domain-containing protein n=1 Tax=Nonomuraea sp. NPDC052129 TaxID=3154651 RepID=UPI00342B9E19